MTKKILSAGVDLFSYKLPVATVVVMICLMSSRPVIAQLTVSNGAQMAITGNLQLTLSNTDFVNNGNFLPGSGTVSFTGGSPSFIKGTQASGFFNLQINKSAGANVGLQNIISVGGQVNFLSGLLDLNGFDADLGSTGSLNSEQESSHIMGASGGMVVSHSTLDAPAAANPGGLGVIITSAQNLGNTVIRRGQQSQANGSASGTSVLRYYEILPANNTALNATVRIHYLEEELNGLDENALLLWEKQGTQDWSPLGADSHDAGANYVEKTAVASFGFFTLATVPTPLPVNFVGVEAHCNGNSVLLNWKTAQEENSHYFSVERSIDGVQWIVLGKVAAAGNTTVETAYSFTDNSPAGDDYYRIAEYDLDGKAQLTKVLHSSCGVRDAFKLWPNPVGDRLYVNMNAAVGGEMIIKLFDGKGALISMQRADLLPGNNLLSVDVRGIAAGVYYAAFIYNNKQVPMQKVIKK